MSGSTSQTFLISSRHFFDGMRGGGKRGTIHRWLRNSPEFREELDRRREEVVESALSSFKSYVLKAVATLGELLDSEDEKVRRAASKDILAHVLRVRESEAMQASLRRQAERVVVQDPPSAHSDDTENSPTQGRKTTMDKALEEKLEIIQTAAEDGCDCDSTLLSLEIQDLSNMVLLLQEDVAVIRQALTCSTVGS